MQMTFTLPGLHVVFLNHGNIEYTNIMHLLVFLLQIALSTCKNFNLIFLIYHILVLKMDFQNW